MVIALGWGSEGQGSNPGMYLQARPSIATKSSTKILSQIKVWLL